MRKPGRYKLRDGSAITVTTVRYHRNGVGGAGFWAVRFTYPQSDVGATEFIGIVQDGAGHEEVYVIDPSNLGNTMRGADWFGDALKRACVARRDEAFGWWDEGAEVA